MKNVFKSNKSSDVDEKDIRSYDPLSSPYVSDFTEPIKEEEFRIVYFNDAEQALVMHAKYCSNSIVTSKYSIISFLPVFLFESFQKVANFFFLVVCILQSIPSISNTYGVPTNAPVLFFVIAIDAVFAIIEDRRRHISDNEANSAKTRGGDFTQPVPVFTQRKWKTLRVGDIVQIHNRELIPADVLILSVCEANPQAPGGICYVETKSLDGETNLKLRQAMEPTLAHIKKCPDVTKFRGHVECELPNGLIEKFTGTLHLQSNNNQSEQKAFPLSSQNILLRGCTLRNTDWVIGIVLNTGVDSKIMQSASKPKSKWSSIMQELNRMILYISIGLFVLCAVAATTYVFWHKRNGETADEYLGEIPLDGSSLLGDWFIILFYYFLLLYQVIPISLYVSMTTVKFFQAKFMEWDLNMYHAESDTPAIVRTMDLNEELGQISYVFTDKTGTLTCNVMDFRKCSIHGQTYGTGMTEIGKAALRRMGQDVPVEPKLDPSVIKTPYVNFIDPSLFDDLRGERGPGPQQHIEAFFLHLAICHTVIPETTSTGDIRFSASSPDEQALVSGAAYFGFKFQSRTVSKIKVKLRHDIVEYEILHVLEFNSTRKRMSVIVKTPQGDIQCLTKGADTVVWQRLNKNAAPDEVARRAQTLTHMEIFAKDGLRTLAIAFRPIDPYYYQKWSSGFTAAMSNLTEVEKRNHGEPNRIDDLMNEMESDLVLLGATAIEDKLQEGVPNALSNLADAGMKIWMLTGDKEETAINIGYACSLLDNNMQQYVMNTKRFPTEDAICEQLIGLTARYRFHQKTKDGQDRIALIIDGEALQLALSPGCAPHLLSFASLCQTVICNRVSPSQKAEIVRLVKDNMVGCRTLAIGDGANDVAMIQAAHVGVGISGQEGMQAVNSSDYAIAQFRFLQTLLLVHGRWNYIRISKLVVYMFYKNSALVLAQYWYGFLGGSTGSKLYWELGTQVYNVLYTGLPVLVLAVLDQDLPPAVSLKVSTILIQHDIIILTIV